EGLVPESALAGRAFLGELSLDGRVRPVPGALALALAARQAGCERLMLPLADAAQAVLVDGLAVEPVATLDEALSVLGGAAPREAPAARERAPELPDLADVRGQPSARRALELAAAGRHNLLLCGPPGTGKTMLAQRLPSILPPLDERTALAVTALHGLLGGAPAGNLRHPPLPPPPPPPPLPPPLRGAPPPP